MKKIQKYRKRKCKIMRHSKVVKENLSLTWTSLANGLGTGEQNNSKTEIFNNNITNETIKQDAKFLKVKNKRNGIS